MKQWITLPSEKIQKYIAKLRFSLTYKSMTQQHSLSHVSRMHHVASICRPSAAFARNLEVWVYSVKQASHHIRMTRPLKKSLRISHLGYKTSRGMRYIHFNQFLKPMDIPDVTLFTEGGCLDQGHWFKNNWNDVQLHHLAEISCNLCISSFIKAFSQ